MEHRYELGDYDVFFSLSAIAKEDILCQADGDFDEHFKSESHSRRQYLGALLHNSSRDLSVSTNTQIGGKKVSLNCTNLRICAVN